MGTDTRKISLPGMTAAPSARVEFFESDGNAAANSVTASAPSKELAGLREKPIGVFDSGVGGLTVLRALRSVLPHENFIYLGDSARAPYGSKSSDVIVRYTRESVAFLCARGVKMVVIACNSASAVALDEITREFSVPIAGVIEPGARAAVKASRGGKIGVIGTEATIASGAYTRAIKRLRADVELYSRACPLLVPLVEEGWTNNGVARETVRHYLSSLRASGIDTLLLGCTHYPLLRGLIQEVVGANVRLVDSATATAREVRRQLLASGLAREATTPPGTRSFFVTEMPDRFVRVGRRFFGPEVESAVRVE